MKTSLWRILLLGVCFLLPGWVEAAPDETPPAAHAALLIVYNHPVAIFREAVFGYTPTDRAREVEKRIRKFMDAGRFGPVTTRPGTEGIMILIDGEPVFQIGPGDVDTMSRETQEETVTATVRRLEEALQAYRDQHDWRFVARAAGFAAAITTLFVVFLWLEVCVWRKLQPLLARLEERVHQRASTTGFNFVLQTIVQLQFVARVVLWGLTIVATDFWLSSFLGQFPYTQPWGEHLSQYLWTIVTGVVGGILSWGDELLVIVVIVLAARGVVWFVNRLFGEIRRGRISLFGLDREVARPTVRILIVIIWLFAAVMAFPYLPGSQSAGFRSVGVFFGLLVSLGASGIMTQVIGGFVLMYSRALKPGEYVRVGEHEGTVIAVGYLSTKIRTPKNEEVNIPNGILMSTTTRNFSRLAETAGAVVYTSVTIGYDTPWRQVQALLLNAAGKTTGLRADPPPYVLQISLGDFYVEYQLNACLKEPETRMATLSALHAQIQDEFNEHGVQIMSPHYRGAPPDRVVVDKKDWWRPPAVKPPES